MASEKHAIEFHPSVCVVYSQGDGKKLFLVSYEKNYPQRAYRNRPNTIGGNPSIINSERDFGPLATLVRELNEEINPDYDEITQPEYGVTEIWAPRNDIKYIRDDVLNGIKSVGDYFVRVNRIGKDEDKMNVPGMGIFSVFGSEMSRDALDILEYNRGKNARIVTEGYAGTFTINQLTHFAKKDPLNISCAHLTPLILNSMFDSNISHPGNIEVLRTEKGVRLSYDDYLEDSELDHRDCWLTH